MGKVLNLFDNLRNAMTGQGTRRDSRSYSQYAMMAPMTQQEVAAAYSGSGLMRKIIQIPALDMVREWRDWKLDGEQITAVEAEEKRLNIRQKVREVEVLRALGGGALILGLPGNLSEPAPPPQGKGQLAFVHVVSRWHLSFSALETDATSELYGEPVMWKLSTGSGQETIHPSRIIPFRADTAAMSLMPSIGTDDGFWGESVVKGVLDAVQDSDTARASFAALLHKARLLRIGIPGLYDMAASGKSDAVFDRLAILATAESMHNATIFDAGHPETGLGGEEVTDATYSFAGAKDILNAYAEFVAAISDIPATRLLGRAPEGMNSSGDSQQKDWNKKIRAKQTLELEPCLERMDRHLVASAIGSMPTSGWYEWAPLDVPSEKEIAETFKTYADGIEKIHASGLVPDEALARGVQSRLTADGYFPELESALAAMPEDERFGLRVEAGALEQEEGGDPGNPVSAGRNGSIGSEPFRRAANDAEPRPLYVRRNLLNAAELIAWAKANGFASTLAEGDMHVTVLYSRNPVDPIKMGETWTSEEDGGLTIKPGGPRALERFNEGAVVLQFPSWSLQTRHSEMVQAGASHDYPEYLPHVTLTYEAPEDMDVASILPFTGALEFGPEIFEPLDLDWKAKIEEA